jgi:CheY-like chemotaxis protein
MEKIRRTLLIEDNEIAQRIPVILLESQGWIVDVESTAREALDAIDRNAYDLILLDIGLPDMDGRELAKIIRQNLSNRCPIMIGLTAHDDIRLAEDSAMDELWSKPLTRELCNLLENKYFSVKLSKING